ncbi:Hin recombinase [Streptomyces lavendulae]|nr:helix-turn-helix domain-containing protein [Streptomyces lavendulae]TXJ78578.1 Hin recombinase [Streptomyces lavendulae]
MTPEDRGWPPLNLRKPLRNQRPRRITPQQIDEIRQALANGATPQELAVRYGVTARTIRRYR